ncbi:MAG: Mrp/NBP35 family ATP-binding protein [Firmicutes bacterium]|nr:P-loop NTPase [Alicyclobacillaceae bacterium]MCL6496725.1 Mrp/NBP35 family ATP-binding protein [Bacillota bacterium]
MPLTRSTLLAGLARFTAPSGIKPLPAGHIRNVAIARAARDGSTAVTIEVDDRWRGVPLSETDRKALADFVRTTWPEVSTVEIRPRSPEAPKAAGPRARALQHIQTPPGVVLLAVLSGKGGVGKTTVSVNLAAALARGGWNVALLDCDLYGFSAPDLMGITELPRRRGRRLLPPVARGVAVMSMRYFVPAHTPVMWRGPLLGKALRQMMEETEWNRPDYMVLDLPPGTGDVALDVHHHFPQAAALVVTTPDPAAAAVAERAGQMALALKRRLLGVVENLAAVSCPHCGHALHLLGQGGADPVAEALGVPVLVRIPWVTVHDRGWGGLVPVGHPVEAVYDALAAWVVAKTAEPGVDPPTTAPDPD